MLIDLEMEFKCKVDVNYRYLDPFTQSKLA
jgi:hypothetical protein